MGIAAQMPVTPSVPAVRYARATERNDRQHNGHRGLFHRAVERVEEKQKPDAEVERRDAPEIVNALTDDFRVGRGDEETHERRSEKQHRRGNDRAEAEHERKRAPDPGADAPGLPRAEVLRDKRGKGVAEILRRHIRERFDLYRRGERRGLSWAISPADRENFRRLLSELDLGLEDRLSSKVGLLSGGQRQALTLLMAVMKKPKVLLLDEHTAALDPKTAAKVLELSDRFVAEGNLTTLMVTHNMKDAIAHGNRLIMMNAGKIVFDVSGEEKKRLTVDDLLHAFTLSTAEEFANDRILLS
jgi:ABC-type dipeptide/oligopeptide/nickel transport system ATPase component